MSANARVKDLGKASNRSAKYCSIRIRTLGGSSRLASMRLVVLVLNRPSLCFFFMIVQAVARWMPSAFACLSKEVYPAATRASAIYSIGLARRTPDDDFISFKYRTVSRRVLRLGRVPLLGRAVISGGFSLIVHSPRLPPAPRTIGQCCGLPVIVVTKGRN
jgi:hypothetical protein